MACLYGVAGSCALAVVFEHRLQYQSQQHDFRRQLDRDYLPRMLFRVCVGRSSLHWLKEHVSKHCRVWSKLCHHAQLLSFRPCTMPCPMQPTSSTQAAHMQSMIAPSTHKQRCCRLRTPRLALSRLHFPLLLAIHSSFWPICCINGNCWHLFGKLVESPMCCSSVIVNHGGRQELPNSITVGTRVISRVVAESVGFFPAFGWDRSVVDLIAQDRCSLHVQTGCRICNNLGLTVAANRSLLIGGPSFKQLVSPKLRCEVLSRRKLSQGMIFQGSADLDTDYS